MARLLYFRWYAAALSFGDLIKKAPLVLLYAIYLWLRKGEVRLDFGFDAVGDEDLVIVPIDAGDGEGDFVSAINVGELKEGVLGDSE